MLLVIVTVVVMLSHQDGCTFLICVCDCSFFPLGLTLFTRTGIPSP